MKGELTASRLTPAGRGGVGVILLEGDGAFDLLVPFFTFPNGKRLSSKEEIGRYLHRPIFGWFYLDSENASHEEAVLHIISANAVEIHCHGGDFIVTAILRRLVNAGAKEVSSLAPPVIPSSEDVPPSFYDDASRLLPLARTERTAKMILDQMNGAPESFLRHAENKLNAVPNNADIPRSDFIKRLDHILSFAALGRHLIDPFRVVLTGPTNAGKSSLTNALVGFERMITNSQEGTTRDAVRIETILDGFPIALIDTAGIREAQSGIEEEGIRRAVAILQNADLILTVFDLTAPGENPAADYFSRLQALCDKFGNDSPSSPRRLILFNKSDLPFEKRNPFWANVKAGKINLPGYAPEDFLTLSAQDEKSVDKLKEKIIQTLIPILPEEGEIIPLTDRQADYFVRLRKQYQAKD